MMMKGYAVTSGAVWNKCEPEALLRLMQEFMQI